MKIARKHLLAAIEAAFESAPVDLDYPQYVLHATTYRQSKKAGVTGIRITWTAK